MYQFVWPNNPEIHLKHMAGLRGFMSDASAITYCHSKPLTSSSALRGLRTVFLLVQSLGPADAGFFISCESVFGVWFFKIYPVDSI